jgi:hypothetical protein
MPLPGSGGAKEQAATPNVSLSAGSAYWLAVMLNAAASLDAGGGTPTGKAASGPTISYTNGFPTLPVSGASVGNYTTEIAVYVRLEDTQ